MSDKINKKYKLKVKKEDLLKILEQQIRCIKGRIKNLPDEFDYTIEVNSYCFDGCNNTHYIYHEKPDTSDIANIINLKTSLEYDEENKCYKHCIERDENE